MKLSTKNLKAILTIIILVSVFQYASAQQTKTRKKGKVNHNRTVTENATIASEETTFYGNLCGQLGYHNSNFGSRAGQALSSNTNENTNIGYSAGTIGASANYNTNVGGHAGYNITGGSNSNFGLNAGAQGGPADNNTNIGAHSGQNVKSSNNVVVGTWAFANGANSSGNVVLGAYSGLDFKNNVNRSILLINNQAQMSNPLLFGYFAGNNTPTNSQSLVTSQAQLAINTNTVKDGFNLTINGATFIGNFGTNGDNKTIINSTKREKYSLWVEKGVVSEDFAVASASSWADYVFDKNYSLRPLTEVETYIKQNNHLPEIPSASEVANNGVSLVDMNKKLLAKVEELTLYQIEANKQNDKQQQEITDLKAELDMLKQKIEANNH